MFDVIVIGTGPAGMAAGIYAAKNKLKTLVISKGPLAQGRESFLDFFGLENLKQEFNGEAKRNKKYLQLLDQEVVSLEKNIVSFSTETKTGVIEYARAVVIATGKAETVFDLITHKTIDGKIKVDSDMRTSVPGIFAAGDVVESLAGDLLTAAGQGATAALGIALYLKQG